MNWMRFLLRHGLYRHIGGSGAPVKPPINLDRLRDLCAGLAGTLGNGQLLAWAHAGIPAAAG